MMRQCRPFALKIFRYSSVGILAALGYMGIAAFFIEVAGFSPLISGVVGFLLALPISYFGHRNWTFRSGGAHSWQAPRFVISAAFVFAASSLSMAFLTERIGLHYGVSFLVTIAAAVSFNFLILEMWVFRSRCLRGAAIDRYAAPDRLISSGLVEYTFRFFQLVLIESRNFKRTVRGWLNI